MYGGLNPLPPEVPLENKTNWLMMTVKKSEVHSAFQTLVRSCYSGDYVNLMPLFYGFLDSPLTCPFTDTHILTKMKGVEVVHIWTMFHLHMTCNSGVLLFQKLS